MALMTGRDFERLIGDAFRRRGFTVTGFGGSGPDGGGDLALIKNGERFLVHCNHWRKPQVGVAVVRELSEVLSAVGARGGYLVTGGHFTREARELAQLSRVELIDGDSLGDMFRQASTQGVGVMQGGDAPAIGASRPAKVGTLRRR
jgi:restriction system protein